MADRARAGDDHERRNRAFWDTDADDYQAVHGDALAARPKAWGVWRIADDTVGGLGDTAGLDVLEYGCGAAQWSVALARDGARCVGLDQSRAQLRHARARVADATVPLVCASGEAVPFADASFDVVFCDHGAMSFCDPYGAVPEVARVLRAGGRFVFAHTTPWWYLAWNQKRDRISRRLHEPYFGIRVFDSGEGTVDFHLTLGEWFRLFGAHGFVVEDLVELQAPEGATTTYEGFDATWARRWPAEQLWKLRKT
ncbi:MAG TPA: class I SAM-dependent methyltransferase [Acidimicrobiia bacterium]